jgi:hypothetical protein
MRDSDIGKMMAEEINLEPFVDAFPLITGRYIEIIGRGESPDFEALVDGDPIGIELTEIRYQAEVDDYVAEVYRLASKKAKSYHRHQRFSARPIMLLCYSDKIPFFDAQRELEASIYWEDFDQLGFTEIWLMDLADAYFGARDPRRPADLFCLTPKKWRGFHRFGSWGRKPYG